jgi:geranylgeranyl pyrophosphate synthase
MMVENNLLLAMQQCSKIIDDAVEKILPISNDRSRLTDAMRYSSLLPGKKMRPFLFQSTLEIFDIPLKNFTNIACALEFIHVYSLIHDDLPAMDDDDFRRGKPSNHKQFDEATAILAGDALLTLAFEIISAPSQFLKPAEQLKIINNIANCAGHNGMVGGQMIDIESINKSISLDKILYIHYLKTAKLFIGAVNCGSIIGNANDLQKIALQNYAKNLGLAFQIKDDLLDFNSNQIIGKSPKNDLSIVELIGIESSQKLLTELRQKTNDELIIFQDKAFNLMAIFDFIINRSK